MGTELVPDIFDSEFSSLGNTGGIQDAVADPLGLGDWAQHPNAPAIAHPSPNQQNRPPYSQPFQNVSAYSAGSQRPRSDWEKTPQELAREHFERTSRTMTRKEQEAKASGDDEGGGFRWSEVSSMAGS